MASDCRKLRTPRGRPLDYWFLLGLGYRERREEGRNQESEARSRRSGKERRTDGRLPGGKDDSFGIRTTGWLDGKIRDGWNRKKDEWMNGRMG